MVFVRYSDRAAIRRSSNRVLAHLLEFRLFLNEPRVVLQAQRNLFVENLRLLRLLMRPILIMTLPTLALLSQLDAFYGHAPLAVGEAAIVTVQLDDPALDNIPALVAPPDIAVETPPVRVVSERQVSWRIRPSQAGSSVLRFQWRNRELTKSLSSGKGVRYLSIRRAGILAFLLHPTEMPFEAQDVDWIEIGDPSAAILGLVWQIWFLIAAAAGALLGFLIK
jgi:hypothetical protein